MEFTAVIKKGEKQFVALCPEIDVVSQGHSVEQALKNLKEAVELHLEVMGFPEGIGAEKPLVTSFTLELQHVQHKPVGAKLIRHAKASTSLG